MTRELCSWEPCLDCADEVNRLLGKLASRDEEVRLLVAERNEAVMRAETAEAALIQAQAEYDEDSGSQWARADAAEAEAARQRTRAERAERERDEAIRLADERLAHANQLQADIEAEQQGRLALRKRLGAREDETMGAFLERLAIMAGVVPAEVHDSDVTRADIEALAARLARLESRFPEGDGR